MTFRFSSLSKKFSSFQRTARLSDFIKSSHHYHKISLGQKLAVSVAAHRMPGHSSGLVCESHLGNFHSGSAEVTINVRERQFTDRVLVEGQEKINAVSLETHRAMCEVVILGVQGHVTRVKDWVRLLVGEQGITQGDGCKEVRTHGTEDGDEDSG